MTSKTKPAKEYTEAEIAKARAITAVVNGRLAGIARAKALSPERRLEIAMMGVKAKRAKKRALVKSLAKVNKGEKIT